MEKLFIKNRKNQKICVLLEGIDNSKGLVFIMHGLSGFKEQPHIQTFAEAFLEERFTVVRFDTTNTLGESEGSYEFANITNYYEDLEDVIKWAKNQPWYEEPFYLVGHSLGGIGIILYAQKYPEQVKAIAPISTTVSGEYIDSYPKEELEEWRKTGWQITKSGSKPGVMKKLRWHQYEEDVIKYNILKDADKIKIPVLLMVGEEDTVTPLKDQKKLYDLLKSKKELHIIKGAPHTFREEQHLKEIKQIIKKWIEAN